MLDAVAENLPYPDKSKDFAVMITTICFVDNIYKAFQENYRILKPKGSLIIGFVDKNSSLGQKYLEDKNQSIFYKEAKFYSTEELYKIFSNIGFTVKSTYQTVFGNLNQINTVQKPLTGYGQGSFVVIKATKKI